MRTAAINLYLVITKAKTRQWVFRYRWQGKEKELGLGSAAAGRVSLKAAREAAQAATRLSKSFD